MIERAAERATAAGLDAGGCRNLAGAQVAAARAVQAVLVPERHQHAGRRPSARGAKNRHRRARRRPRPRARHRPRQRGRRCDAGQPTRCLDRAPADAELPGFDEARAGGIADALAAALSARAALTPTATRRPSAPQLRHRCSLEFIERNRYALFAQPNPGERADRWIRGVSSSAARTPASGGRSRPPGNQPDRGARHLGGGHAARRHAPARERLADLRQRRDARARLSRMAGGTNGDAGARARRCTSRAATNHLAFTFDPRRGLLALPSIATRALPSRATLELFAVDPTTGFAPRGTIEHGGPAFRSLRAALRVGILRDLHGDVRGLFIGDSSTRSAPRRCRSTVSPTWPHRSPPSAAQIALAAGCAKHSSA